MMNASLVQSRMHAYGICLPGKCFWCFLSDMSGSAWRARGWWNQVNEEPDAIVAHGGCA